MNAARRVSLHISIFEDHNSTGGSLSDIQRKPKIGMTILNDLHEIRDRGIVSQGVDSRQRMRQRAASRFGIEQQ